MLDKYKWKMVFWRRRVRETSDLNSGRVLAFGASALLVLGFTEINGVALQDHVVEIGFYCSLYVGRFYCKQKRETSKI